MTCFMYIDGKKQEMNEDIFDQMVEALNPETVQDPPNPSIHKMVNKYYQKKLSTPFQCPDCGRTISSKSNLSKHRQTKICMTDG